MDKYDMPGIGLYQCERHVLIHDLEAKFSLALDEGEGEAELLKYLFVKGNSIHDYANRLASRTARRSRHTHDAKQRAPVHGHTPEACLPTRHSPTARWPRGQSFDPDPP